MTISTKLICFKYFIINLYCFLNKNEIKRICNIFSVKDYDDLLESILKTEKVMKAVPKFEQIIMDICKIVLPKAGFDINQANIDVIEIFNQVSIISFFEQ